MYYTGEGIEASKLQAYKWFLIAGELGNEDAKDNQELAADSLKRSELAKARKLAAQWLKEFQLQ